MNQLLQLVHRRSNNALYPLDVVGRIINVEGGERGRRMLELLPDGPQILWGHLATTPRVGQILECDPQAVFAARRELRAGERLFDCKVRGAAKPERIDRHQFDRSLRQSSSCEYQPLDRLRAVDPDQQLSGLRAREDGL